MQTAAVSRPPVHQTQALVGKIRRFWPYGVLYEIIAFTSPDMARIRVLETGEITDYCLDRLLADPED